MSYLCCLDSDLDQFDALLQDMHETVPHPIFALNTKSYSKITCKDRNWEWCAIVEDEESDFESAKSLGAKWVLVNEGDAIDKMLYKFQAVRDHGLAAILVLSSLPPPKLTYAIGKLEEFLKPGHVMLVTAQDNATQQAVRAALRDADLFGSSPGATLVQVLADVSNRQVSGYAEVQGFDGLALVKGTKSAQQLRQSFTSTSTSTGSTGLPDDILQSFQFFKNEHLSHSYDDMIETHQHELMALVQDSWATFDAGDYPTCADLCEKIIAMTWGRLESTRSWPNVCWRESYGMSELLYVACNLRNKAMSKALLERCDRAAIMGVPTAIISPFFRLLNPIVRNERIRHQTFENDAAYIMPMHLLRPESAPTIRFPIPNPRTLSGSEFTRHVDHNMPVQLRGITNEWPASARWSNLQYMNKEHGHRLVPIELGSHAENTWREEFMTIEKFIEEYLKPDIISYTTSAKSDAPSTSQIAYLAQHPLFDQLSGLKNDFHVPAHCSVGRHAGTNSWLGTGGTITPLHFDSYDNILTQVCGFKYVRLYAPSETEFICNEADRKAPGDHNYLDAQANLSQLQPENPDLTQYKDVHKAKYVETILGPGDALFIPTCWWHHVRALTTSFSVNFWFL